MKNSVIKKGICLVLAIALFSCIFSKLSAADTAQIDLNSLDDIVTTDNNTVENNVTNNTNTSNTTNTSTSNTTDTSTKNTTNNTTEALPQTGSNNEIIYVIGLTVLVGSMIYVYKKIKF